VSMRCPDDLWKFRLPEERKQTMVTSYTYDMMWLTYGLTRLDVLDAEHALLSTAVGTILNNNVLNHIIDVDRDSL